VTPNPLNDIARQRARDAADGVTQRIRVDIDGPRATVVINRPEVHNCFDYLTLLELADTFHDLARNVDVHVVVLTGAGDKAFSSGADMREQRDVLVPNPQLYHTWMGAFIDVHDRLRNIGKPTIARLNGLTVGGGNEFNMACDLAIAADHVYIRHVGPYHGSVPAGGATQWLPIFVGDRRAREILWLGENIQADKALEWGLVNRVVAASELDSAVDDMVARLMQTLPETMRYMRTQTNFFKDLSWYQTIHHARDWLALHTNAPEVREAIGAFTDKRPLDHRAMHDRYGTPEGAYAWGAPLSTCSSCGARDLPNGFTHCGNCGAALPASSSAPTTDAKDHA
jgi:enoyl-CoA hydratase/carnithine racemase